MMGGAFAPLRSHLRAVRDDWAYLNEEVLAGTGAYARTMGIFGKAGATGAALASRAYGLDLAETAGAFGTFERFTRGGLRTGKLLRGSPTGLEALPGAASFASATGAGRTGIGEGMVRDAPDLYGALPGDGPLESGGIKAWSRKMASGTAAIRNKMKAEARDEARTLAFKKILRYGSPSEKAAAAAHLKDMGIYDVHPFDAARDAPYKAKLAAKLAAKSTPKTTPAGPGSTVATDGSGSTVNRSDSILINAFGKSGLPAHLAGEFFESSAGLARTFAGHGRVADPMQVTGMLGLLGGAGFGGMPGAGLEPREAADLLGRFKGGTEGMGDETAYTMKVRALSRLKGPVTIDTKFGPMTLDPKNPLHLRMLMEEGINNPAIRDAYMGEASSFGALAPRALAAMSGGAISEVEATGLGRADISGAAVKGFFKRPAGTTAIAAATAAMATKGGELTRGEAVVEGNLEGLGEVLGTLRDEVRVATSHIAAAATKPGSTMERMTAAMGALAKALIDHPGLLAAYATGKALSSDDPITAAAWAGAGAASAAMSGGPTRGALKPKSLTRP
jgi:hypothetical protein